MMGDVWLVLDALVELMLALVIWYAVPLLATALVIVVSLVGSHTAAVTSGDRR